MSERKNMNRRNFLTRAGAALVGGGGITAALRGAMAEDTLLETLIEQNQSAESGEGFDAASRTVQMPKASLPTLSPATVQTTEQAIVSYESLVAQGGWPNVPSTHKLRLGMRHPSVGAMRRRLQVVGDLDVDSGQSDVYDSYVERAVRRFQARHGLNVDGIVREQTLNAMNIPAAARLNQLKINLIRLRAMGPSLPHRHVTANIPAAQIEAIEGGVAITRHTAVVGKPDRASPELASKITEINFNPYWTVPVSIVRKDLIRFMQDDPEYLSK